MSKLNLSRLWYIFPPEDQELKGHQFERKVSSFLQNLPLDHKRAVLDFLTIQYAAFQQQLRLMLSRAALSRSEYSVHSARLRDHVQALHTCRQLVGPSSRGDGGPAGANAAHGRIGGENSNLTIVFGCRVRAV